MTPYLHRLYLEARSRLVRILLDDMAADPEQTEILERIDGLIASEEKFNAFRARLGEHFPGTIARLMNLVDENEAVFPIEALRESIRRHIKQLREGTFDYSDRRAIDILKQSSKLQQQLAYLVNYTPGKWLLEQELASVELSRSIRLKSIRGVKAEESGLFSRSYVPGTDAYAWSRDQGRLRGLCLSGGGIRSATFNLGVLQGLAKKRLLHQFDYCSSVSGGGYIHQWLAAWIKREEEPARKIGKTGLDVVSEQLVPLPDQGCLHFPPEPIKWLRRYSNYLTPQTGMFGADLWVTVAIWVRNMFLNQIVLISGLMCLLLLPHVLIMRDVKRHLPALAASMASAGNGCSYHFAWLHVAIVGLIGLAYMMGVVQVARGFRAARIASPREERLSSNTLRWLVVFPFLVAAVAIADFSFYFEVPGLCADLQTWAVAFFSFGGMVALAVGLNWAGSALRDESTGRPAPLRVAGFTAAALFSGAVCAACMVGLRLAALHYLPMMEFKVGLTHSSFGWRVVVALGPFAVVLVSFVGIVLHCGLVGNGFDDKELEWLGRTRAWVTMYNLAFTGWMLVSIFGYDMVHWVVKHGPIFKWPALGTWMLTTAAGVLTGKSSATSETATGSRTLKIVTLIGPPVYICGLLVLISSCLTQELHWATEMLTRTGSHLALLMVIALPFLIFALFGWRVDVNEFSMHSYYRNRLARCYLGASNPRRNPDPLTGFDSNDVKDMQVSRFRPAEGYSGPLPIFCATLNISMGEDLAWQERKAASFAFSPILSGYYVPWTGSAIGELSFNGFVPTDRFGKEGGGVLISTAAAISGAAMSPNAGYHTSPPMAFLLTMFNVRLGWWMRNPRRSQLAFDPTAAWNGRERFTPAFAPNLLKDELLGRIGDDREFIYLTDGGHFDNMGLYELVRRRCYDIVICDAEQDDGPVFEGIGMAIRKCRIDFGVEIELDLNAMATDAATKLSKVHWITGTIRYPETGDAEPGRILYIKSSITGREAADVYNYRLQHAVFPQDSTTDQWFTESQFESYRRLGQQVVDECPYLVVPPPPSRRVAPMPPPPAEREKVFS